MYSEYSCSIQLHITYGSLTQTSSVAAVCGTVNLSPMQADALVCLHNMFSPAGNRFEEVVEPSNSLCIESKDKTVMVCQQLTEDEEVGYPDEVDRAEALLSENLHSPVVATEKQNEGVWARIMFLDYICAFLLILMGDLLPMTG